MATQITKLNLVVELLILLWLLSMLSQAIRHFGPSQLQGPSNRSVHLQSSVTMVCRVDFEARQNEPSHALSRHETIQWIINGFGVTNETLESIYGPRYLMPGDPLKGVYDLEIVDIEMKDEAAFVCQVSYQDVRQGGGRVETLASEPAYLSVIVPPRLITMTRVDDRTRSTNYRSHQSTHQSDSSSSKINTSPPTIGRSSAVVADDPSPGSNNNSPSSQTGMPNKQPSHLLNQKQSIDRVWAVVNSRLLLECATSPSRPLPAIQWWLDGRRLVNSAQGHLRHGNDDGSLADVDADVEISERIINETQSVDEANSDLFRQVAISELRMTVLQRFLHVKLECRIANGQDFQLAALPVTGTILEPIFIDSVKITIAKNNSRSNVETLKEGSTVFAKCSSITNPPSPTYSWTFLPNQTSKPHNSWNHKASIHGREQHHDQLTGGGDQREHSIKSTSDDSSLLMLRVDRSMHKGRLRCWVTVRDPSQSSVVGDKWIEKMSTSEGNFQSTVNTWRMFEQELDVLYDARFLPSQSSNNHDDFDLIAVDRGETVKLNCSVDANPPARVTWYKVNSHSQTKRLSDWLERRDLELIEGHRHHQSIQIVLKSIVKDVNSKLIGTNLQNISLPLSSITKHDFGFYICSAHNHDEFSPAYHHVYLGQTAVPKITQIKQEIDEDGQTGSLTCVLHSIPRPRSNELIWLKNGVPMPSSSSNHRIVRRDLWQGALSTLQFNQLTSDDSVEYNCSTRTPVGSAWKAVTISTSNRVPLIFSIGISLSTITVLGIVLLLACLIRTRRQRRAVGSDKRVFVGRQSTKSTPSQYVKRDLQQPSLDHHSLTASSFDSSNRLQYDLNGLELTPNLMKMMKTTTSRQLGNGDRLTPEGTNYPYVLQTSDSLCSSSQLQSTVLPPQTSFYDPDRNLYLQSPGCHHSNLNNPLLPVNESVYIATLSSQQTTPQSTLPTKQVDGFPLNDNSSTPTRPFSPPILILDHPSSETNGGGGDGGARFDSHQPRPYSPPFILNPSGQFISSTSGTTITTGLLLTPVFLEPSCQGRIDDDGDLADVKVTTDSQTITPSLSHLPLQFKDFPQQSTITDSLNVPDYSRCDIDQLYKFTLTDGATKI